MEGNEIHKEEDELFVLDGHVLGAYAHLEDKFLAARRPARNAASRPRWAKASPSPNTAARPPPLTSRSRASGSTSCRPLDDALAQKMGLQDARRTEEQGALRAPGKTER